MDGTHKLNVNPQPQPVAPVPISAGRPIPVGAPATSQQAPATPVGVPRPVSSVVATPVAVAQPAVAPVSQRPVAAVPATPAPVQSVAPQAAVSAINPPPASSATATPAAPSLAPVHDSLSDDDFLDDLKPEPLVKEKLRGAVSRKIGPGEFPVKNTILSVIVLLLTLMLVNILLDADFLSWGFPHTDFL